MVFQDVMCWVQWVHGGVAVIVILHYWTQRMDSPCPRSSTGKWHVLGRPFMFCTHLEHLITISPPLTTPFWKICVISTGCVKNYMGKILALSLFPLVLWFLPAVSKDLESKSSLYLSQLSGFVFVSH